MCRFATEQARTGRAANPKTSLFLKYLEKALSVSVPATTLTGKIPLLHPRMQAAEIEKALSCFRDRGFAVVEQLLSQEELDLVLSSNHAPPPETHRLLQHRIP